MVGEFVVGHSSGGGQPRYDQRVKGLGWVDDLETAVGHSEAGACGGAVILSVGGVGVLGCEGAISGDPDGGVSREVYGAEY